MDTFFQLIYTLLRWLLLFVVLLLGLAFAGALLLFFALMLLIQTLRGKPMPFNFQRMKGTFHAFRPKNTHRAKEDVEDAKFYPSKKNPSSSSNRLH